jgi:hypothetical protein
VCSFREATPRAWQVFWVRSYTVLASDGKSVVGNGWIWTLRVPSFELFDRHLLRVRHQLPLSGYAHLNSNRVQIVADFVQQRQGVLGLICVFDGHQTTFLLQWSHLWRRLGNTMSHTSQR